MEMIRYKRHEGFLGVYEKIQEKPFDDTVWESIRAFYFFPDLDSFQSGSITELYLRAPLGGGSIRIPLHYQGAGKLTCDPYYKDRLEVERVHSPSIVLSAMKNTENKISLLGKSVDVGAVQWFSITKRIGTLPKVTFPYFFSGSTFPPPEIELSTQV